jgi:phosphoglycerate dehydrogenase-like enzyme
MRVVATRRTSRPSPAPGIEVLDSLAAVAEQADHLVVAAPSTAATRHLIGDAVLRAVKPGVHLINIARGALVDQDALLAALDDGRVARATLDVVDPEPLPAGHPLYTHPRVFITPHVSWSSPRLWDRWTDNFVNNLRRYVAGQPLLDIVDRELGY